MISYGWPRATQTGPIKNETFLPSVSSNWIDSIFYSSNLVRDSSEPWATSSSSRDTSWLHDIDKTYNNMCVAAQSLLLESEPLLLLHMPRTVTFVPRTAHYVAEAPLFSFHVFSPVLSGRAAAEESDWTVSASCHQSAVKIILISSNPCLLYLEHLMTSSGPWPCQANDR